MKEGIYGIDPKNPDTKNYTAITISQYGEPLLYPEKVKRAIEFTKSLNLRCDLQTNGVNLDKDLIKEFKDLGLDILMVSLSASTPETHERITGSKTFERVLENIKIASKYFYTIVRSVYIPGFNREELIELSEILSRESKVKEIMVHHLIVHRGNRDRLEGICNVDGVGRVRDLLLLVDEMGKRAPDIRVTIKGCLLVNLKGLDGYLLNAMTLDCFSEVPVIKREYFPFFNTPSPL